MSGALAQRLARQHLQQIAKKNMSRRAKRCCALASIRSSIPIRSSTAGRGCDVCKQTGYKGRTGIYELMQINEELQELIVRRAPVTEVKEAARANGMMTLQEDGFRKCKDGHTTVEEVMRVVFTGGH